MTDHDVRRRYRLGVARDVRWFLKYTPTKFLYNFKALCGANQEGVKRSQRQSSPPYLEQTGNYPEDSVTARGLTQQPTLYLSRATELLLKEPCL